MTTADYSDQTGLFNPADMADCVTLIGLGGIGATLLPTLVTMGIRRFVLWDPDKVEERNLASTVMYKPDDLGKSKAEVCKDYLLLYGAEEVEIHTEWFTADSPLEQGIVISGVDSMAARQTIWQAVEQSGNVDLYLDGRIGGESAVLFAFEPWDEDTVRKYQNHMFGDDKAAPLPCTQRGIVYPSVVLSGFIANAVAAFVRNGEVKNWQTIISMTNQPDVMTF